MGSVSARSIVGPAAFSVSEGQWVTEDGAGRSVFRVDGEFGLQPAARAERVASAARVPLRADAVACLASALRFLSAQARATWWALGLLRRTNSVVTAHLPPGAPLAPAGRPLPSCPAAPARPPLRESCPPTPERERSSPNRFSARRRHITVSLSPPLHGERRAAWRKPETSSSSPARALRRGLSLSTIASARGRQCRSDSPRFPPA